MMRCVAVSRSGCCAAGETQGPTLRADRRRAGETASRSPLPSRARSRARAQPLTSPVQVVLPVLEAAYPKEQRAMPQLVGDVGRLAQ